MEILRFVFQDLWHWLGSFLMLAVVCQTLYYIVAVIFRVNITETHHTSDASPSQKE